ncbi:MAG TPA: acyl-CoA dehydrogenase [Burkholderiaceae bacterium]|nr:acyl-CoA dehydrogenase [Burkholderiaceae bacterium]HQR69555.1 acyl-CoA dehydrogenase [Burkholderiaceae bacterium]
MSYTAPIKDMLFVLHELAGLKQVQQLPGCEEATDETVQAVLEENARFMAEVVAPLNTTGDTQPSTWSNGNVTTTPGFRTAFRSFVEAGWQGIQHPAEFGGQGLPKLVGAPCMEMMQAANLSFALCPLLTDGAIEALLVAGTEEQKQAYLPRLIDGTWTGTMNLTEPQAGSDLAQVRTRAVRQADGTYRVFGQKIFITYGDHDLAENIIHLVLARTPDAPEGVKGISLFIVPKVMLGADGALGKRNDVYCASIEHKLGIKASPTAVLLFGEDKGEVGPGALGYLIGEENRGLEYMFVMMNAARFQVGMQGIAVSDRAYQKAAAYAKDRVQSRAVEGSSGPVAIINHPDVRRMLMFMRSSTEAARAIAYVAAGYHDIAHLHPDAAVRKEAQAAYEYLVPIVKGWSTENSIDIASTGVQVHGGMGFIEETGAAQFYRDARILTIYEGTTAIQANDLIGRKTSRDGGATARRFIAQMRATAAELAGSGGDCAPIGARLAAAVDAYESAVDFVVKEFKSDIRSAFAGSVPYLKLAGVVHGGWQLGRSALAARRMIGEGRDIAFAQAKIATARFFADHMLVTAPGLADSIAAGSVGTLALAIEQF